MDINYASLNDMHVTLSSAFFNALAAAPPSQWAQIADRFGSSSDHNDYPFLGELSDMREWIGPRHAEQLESFRYSIINKHYEKTMSADRVQIEDDAGGAIPLYSSRAAIMARAVSRHPDQLMFGTIVPGGATSLCYDGQYFFDTDHPVGSGTMSNHLGGAGTAWYLLDLSAPLRPFIFQERQTPRFQAMIDLNSPNVFFEKKFIWGADARYNGGYGLWQTAILSKQTLSGANYDAAQDRFSTFTNDEGVKLGTKGTALLYPSSLRTTVRDVFKPQLGSGGASNVYFAENSSLQLIESPWL